MEVNMNILFIEDNPEYKIKHVIEYLKTKKLDFSYKIVKSCSSAMRYLFKHFNEIDLIILDLGLPFSDDGSEYDSLEGLFIIEELLRKNIKIPVIINSTTEIPNEKELFEKYLKQNSIIQHVPELKGNFLFDFIKNIDK
jgi:CheY-like chemotaxis protein